MSEENRQLNFKDCLDTIQVIEKPVREGLGEDSFYCAESNNSAIVSVFDGCGGLGARKYESFSGKSGAYIASRIVSGAVRDWYSGFKDTKWTGSQELANSLEGYIKSAYEICERYAEDGRRVLGTMVRDFPTTMAFVYAEMKEDILLTILWAGDSRVYMLSETGLRQLTKDDTDIEDALENLTKDGAMHNVLSSDKDYQINRKTFRIANPGIVFAATDGCFGYFSSPMEFEYCVLKTIVESDTPETFREALRSLFEMYAGDDFTLGMMSFYYGSYDKTRKSLKKRLSFVEQNYIIPLERNQTGSTRQKLWEKYKKGYEQYLELV